MNVLLTSCGLETPEIEDIFLKMLPKPAGEVRAMFIPTAAVSPDAIEVLPKCLNDLLKCGVKRENISVCDLHDEVDCGLFDVVYICGGNPVYLMKRINERGFGGQLMEFIDRGGVVVGVSAGSMIFADCMPGNLGLLKCPLDVHCSDCEKPGKYPRDRRERVRLGNLQAITFTDNSFEVFG